jgi:hypothetical protein
MDVNENFRDVYVYEEYPTQISRGMAVKVGLFQGWT